MVFGIDDRRNFKKFRVKLFKGWPISRGKKNCRFGIDIEGFQAGSAFCIGNIKISTTTNVRERSISIKNFVRDGIKSFKII